MSEPNIGPVMVEVPMERLLRLRAAAWSLAGLVPELDRRERADYGELTDEEIGDVGIYAVAHYAVEDARRAFRDLNLSPDIMDGYETLSIGPGRKESSAIRATWGPPS